MRFEMRKTKGKNIFVSYLALLGVRFTGYFANQYYNEHPHKYNLYGLSKMLSDYGVDNGAIQITDKENDLPAIKTPFVAHFGGDFVGVYDVDSEKVSFIWMGAKQVLTVSKFIESWSGIVLLTETTENSIEPHYREHRKIELLNNLKQITFFLACGLIAVSTYIHQSYFLNAGVSVLLLVNFLGLYVSWMLLLKQMHIQSRYADKICSLFKQRDCNNVLESNAAKLFGLISLSEIGFGYFLTNILLLLFFPDLLPTIALFNILTLPFTLWSVWYQRIKAKQWCVLCLLVLLSLWAIFIVNCFFGYVQINGFSNFTLSVLFYILIPTLFYFVSIVGINMLVPKLNTDKKMQSLQQSMNSMKADEDLFVTLLKKQPFYETNDCDSVIRFGNPDSVLRLTVLSNPQCSPCSKMHNRINELLKQANNNISVQYILSSFGENRKSTNKYLIAACLADKTGAMEVLKDWFDKGKLLGDDYFKDLCLNIDNPEIEVEYEKHEAWQQKTQIKATPTVLVNGYQLPESYKIEDLRHFTELNISLYES